MVLCAVALNSPDEANQRLYSRNAGGGGHRRSLSTISVIALNQSATDAIR